MKPEVPKLYHQQYLKNLANELLPYASEFVGESKNNIFTLDSIIIKEYEKQKGTEIILNSIPEASSSSRFSDFTKKNSIIIWFPRSLINFVGNISECYSNLYRTPVEPKLDHNLVDFQIKQIANITKQAVSGEILFCRDPTIPALNKPNAYQIYLFEMGLNFILAHEVGHAIYKYQTVIKEEDSDEYLHALKFIKQEMTLAEEQSHLFAKELACDIIGLKLILNKYRNVSDLLIYWSIYQSTFFFEPCNYRFKQETDKKLKHPFWRTRLYFLHNNIESTYLSDLLAIICSQNLSIIKKVRSHIGNE